VAIEIKCNRIYLPSVAQHWKNGSINCSLSSQTTHH